MAMEVISMSLRQIVHDNFRQRNIARAIAELEAFIANQNSQEFSCLPKESFSNSPSSILAEVNRFIRANCKQFDMKAVYLEMNGFGINYDEWFFNPFGYRDYSRDYEDTEWLSDWQSSEWPQVVLHGMKSSQQAFAWYHEERIWESQPQFEPIYEASSLLIVARFTMLIGDAIRSGKLAKPIPVLATAHDFYDFVARYEP
jgi:hypothetical protein